jgi:hypothetical protein
MIGIEILERVWRRLIKYIGFVLQKGLGTEGNEVL